MDRNEERVKFEIWFQSVESGDGENALPEPKDGLLWRQYLERHQIALGAWMAAKGLS